jgi:hypothetical protein
MASRLWQSSRLCVENWGAFAQDCRLTYMLNMMPKTVALKQHSRHILGAFLAIFFAAAAFAADPVIPPIKALTDIKTTDAVFKDSSAKKPIVIKTAEEAKKYFAAEQVAELQKKADFKQQMLLIFAWQGSGQDKITYAIAESYPEQIFFTYEMGRTRDLRQHQQLYLLRTNVTWSVKP